MAAWEICADPFHPVAICSGLWGMPIGEFFDLEALTEHCQKTRRWTMYFTSWPLNLWGGVASTANAGATF